MLDLKNLKKVVCVHLYNIYISRTVKLRAAELMQVHL